MNRAARSPVAGGTLACLLVLVVAGTGLTAVVATSLGLLPLVGEPTPGVDAWAAAAPELVPAVRETLVLATASTLLAAVAGLLVAAVVLDGVGGPVVRATALAVLAVPHLVGATSVALLLSDGGVAARLSGATGGSWPALVGGPWPVATVLELAWKESAFVALVVVAALARDHRLRRETAAVLGASAWQRWRTVLVPAAAPGVGAASLVVFVYGVGSYEVAWLLGRAYPEPLAVTAMRLFGSIDLAARPVAAAVASTGVGLALLVALAAVAWSSRLRTGLATVGPQREAR